MKLLPVDQIKPDADQPRRTFNEEKMDGLKASIKDGGFWNHESILIDGDNTIIDGERRWRAAKDVGIK